MNSPNQKSTTLNSLTNFRDLGGHRTKSGQVVKPGRLLRAGELTDLTAQDIETLITQYGLVQVLDLRSAAEVTQRPNVDLGAVTSLHLDVFAGDQAAGADPDSYKQYLVSADAAAGMLLGLYQHMVLAPTARQAFALMINELIANTSGATLIHCAAGKDRTGLGSAIVLRMLGVPMDDVMADYLATIAGRETANAELIAQHRAQGLPETALAALATMYSVKPEYLQVAFAAIDKEFGTFEAYVDKGLGITPQQLNALKEGYLTDTI